MKKIALGFCASITTVLLFTGCLKNNSDDFASQTCTYDSCAVKAPAGEIQAVQQYLTDSSITATQHCSGMFYNVVTAGNGLAPTPCSYVTVKYVGKLANGTVFDKTADGATYSQYLSNLIRGWVNALPYVKEGGKIRLYVPPSLGYGSQAVGSIPANSVLVFEVELIDVQ